MRPVQSKRGNLKKIEGGGISQLGLMILLVVTWGLAHDYQAKAGPRRISQNDSPPPADQSQASLPEPAVPKKKRAVAEEFAGVTRLPVCAACAAAKKITEATRESVSKTGRAIVANEAPKIGGLGTEVSATIAEEVFGRLKAPGQRICGLDTPIPFSVSLEKIILPDKDNIKTAVRAAMAY